MIGSLFRRSRKDASAEEDDSEGRAGLGSLKDAYELGNTILDDAKFVVFDTELTGLNVRRDSIVSLGAVKMVGGRISVGDYFYRVVEPETELTAGSIVIHEITPSEAASSPAIGLILPEFLDFCTDSVLVGHFVSLDLSFINKEMKRLKGSPLLRPAVDTRKLFSWLMKKEDNSCAFDEKKMTAMDLSSLARRYQIPFLKAHNALEDAFVTAQLFQRLLTELPSWGIRTVADLLTIGRP